MLGSCAGWPKEAVNEPDCSGGDGAGLAAVAQSKEPGWRIFPPRCSECEGEGRTPVK
jgi:hypothetical protein